MAHFPKKTLLSNYQVQILKRNENENYILVIFL